MLDKIIAYYSDPLWWATTAFSTIVLALTTVWIGKVLSNSKNALFRRWSNRSERYKEMRRARIALMREDRAMFQYFIHMANIDFHTATLSLVGAFMCFVILMLAGISEGEYPLLLIFPMALISVLAGVTGFKHWIQALEMEGDLHTSLFTSENVAPEQTSSDNR